MSTFEEALFTYLSTLGLSCSTRVYPIRLPQGVPLPAMTYQLVSDAHDYTQTGQSTLNDPRYQINCWGSTYGDAKSLAEALIAQVSGYKGSMGSATTYAAFMEDDRDNVDPVTGRCWVSVDVRIFYSM